jgi:hypothetical protein
VSSRARAVRIIPRADKGKGRAKVEAPPRGKSSISSEIERANKVAVYIGTRPPRGKRVFNIEARKRVLREEVEIIEERIAVWVKVETELRRELARLDEEDEGLEEDEE